MVVLGAGRVGTALHNAAVAAGQPSALVTRTSGHEALAGAPGTPILLCVRNDALLDALEAVPAHRRDDLVFVQNGAMRPWLREQALAGSTRGLLYFLVARVGDPIAGGDASIFCGPHANAVTGWLIESGVEARSVDWGRFSWYEAEKMIWIASMGLLCEHHDCDVGTVVTTHADDLGVVAAELATVARATMGVEAPQDFLVQRLTSYSNTIPHYRASVKAWEWRNGWFVHAAARYGIALPRHAELLAAIGKGPPAS